MPRRNSVRQGTQAQQHGKQGEQIGAGALRRMGILQVEKIATPYIKIKHPTDFGYYRIKETEKVAGDWRGILTNGVSVISEIKTRYGNNLAWSDFEPHQIEKLYNHAELAISLVVYVHDYGVNVMRWPVIGFDKPRCSITPARADELDIQFQPVQNLINSWLAMQNETR